VEIPKEGTDKVSGLSIVDNPIPPWRLTILCGGLA
jgi:hypothetical protein